MFYGIVVDLKKAIDGQNKTYYQSIKSLTIVLGPVAISKLPVIEVYWIIVNHGLRLLMK